MGKRNAQTAIGLLAAYAMVACITSNKSATPQTTLDPFVVRNLSAGYDTLAGVARIHWSPPKSARTKAYRVYRARPGDASLSQNLVVTLQDTFFVDTIYRLGDNEWVNLIEPGSISVPNTAAPARWPTFRYTYSVRAVDTLEQDGPIHDSMTVGTAAPTFVQTLHAFTVNGYWNDYLSAARPGAELTFIFQYFNPGRLNRRIRWFQGDTSVPLHEKTVNEHSGSDSLSIRMPAVEGDVLLLVIAEDEAGSTWKFPFRMKISLSAAVTLHGPDTSNLSPDVRILAPLPAPRAQLAAAELGGKLYAVGGMNGSRDGHPASADQLGLATAEEYDPASGTWRSLASMHWPRHDLGLVAVKGRLYAVGGWHKGVIQDTMETYDPAVDAWTPLAPTAPAGVQSEIFPLGSVGDTLYAIMQDHLNHGHTCAFIPGTDSTWRDLHADFIHAWWGEEINYRYASIGNTIHLYGRYGDESSHYIFNLATKAWTAGPDMPMSTTLLTVAAIGSKAYAAFGLLTSQSMQNALSNGFQIFDSATDTWSQAPGFKGRTGAALIASSEGKLYLIGGGVAGKAVATLEVLSAGP